MDVINITENNYKEEVLSQSEPVLLDFWAPWCGPCRMLSPIVDEVARDAVGFRVGKVNADEESALVDKFGIQSIPTLAVIKNGEVVKTSLGVISKEEILDLLK